MHLVRRCGALALPALLFLATAAPGAAQMAPQTPASPAAPAAAGASASPAPVADPKILAMAKDLLHRAATNTLDPSTLTSQMVAELTPDIGKSIASALSAFGEPSAFAYAGTENMQGLQVYGFIVTFASGTVREVFALDASGKIAALRFTPQ
jgi:hypothetical protein